MIRFSNLFSIEFDNGFRGLPFPLFWLIDLPFSWFSLGSLCLFCISFRINFNIVVVNYTDDGSLELGSVWTCLIIWKCLNGTMTLILVVFILR